MAGYSREDMKRIFEIGLEEGYDFADDCKEAEIKLDGKAIAAEIVDGHFPRALDEISVRKARGAKAGK